MDDFASDADTFPRARATSAAPIYFKPYQHIPTEKTYVDGAVVRNNPVRVADQERKLIWNQGTHRADIILSIGSKIQQDSQGHSNNAKNSKTKKMLKRLPGGIRVKLTTGYDMVESTLNCEKEWIDFCHSVRDDPSFSQVLHRLNVGLDGKPPKLDEVVKMDALQSQAEQFFRTPKKVYNHPHFNTAHEHLRAVVRRLIASLFYFEEASREKSLSQTKTQRIVGYLRCRLRPELNRHFTRLLEDKPQFSITEEGMMPKDITNLDFDMATFSSKVDIGINGDAESWIIKIYFPTQSWGSEWEPISGFS